MKRAVLLVSVLLLGLLPGMIEGEEPAALSMDGGRQIEVPYAFEPPQLDGNIGSLEWYTEFTTNYFDAFDGLSFREVYPPEGSDEEFTDQADLAVTFYLLYDDTYLYFAANVTDQNIVVDSGETFWRDDGVELMIDGAFDMDDDQRAGDPWPGFEDGTTLLAKADGSYYYDYSSSTPYERSFGEGRDWFAATRTVPSANYYIVEMMVRLDSIASPEPNGTIGFNVGINDDDTGGLSKTALKWCGRETAPDESPTFKNESLWGTAHLRSYVEARLPQRIDVDEDLEVEVSAGSSIGNHPDFETGSNFTWRLPIYRNGEWANLTSFDTLFVHTFEEPLSFYTLVLELRDPSGESDTAVTRVYVKDVTPPDLEFSDAVAFEETPFTYVMNATDNVGVSRVEWSLQDHGWYNLTTKVPFFDHTFMSPGDYTLSFSAFDEENNTQNGTARITVLDDAPPIIEGGISDLLFYTSRSFDLSAPTAYDDTEDGPSTDLSYSWSFRGGFGDFRFFGPTIEVQIDIPGPYLGMLTVTDGIGLSSFLTFNVSVLDDTPPVPEFFLPLELEEDLQFELDASGSFDNDPLLWNSSVFTWVITSEGGGSFIETLSGPVVIVEFPFPGTARVTLFIEDPSGNVANLSRLVLVLDNTPPVAVFHLDKDIVDQNERFFLNITGSSDNVGLLSAHFTIVRVLPEGEEPVFSTPFFGVRILNATGEEMRSLEGLMISIEGPGPYRIDMMIKDLSGLEDHVSANITVRDSISPRAVINRTILYVEPKKSFFLSGSGSTDATGPLTFEWLLENETPMGVSPDLVWTFTAPGNHTVVLKVTDTGGNVDLAFCRVIVSDPAEKGGDQAGHTLLFIIWGVAIFIILVGVLLALFWIRKKRADVSTKKGEE
ncbi:MAG: hypothetical protein JXA22_10670 [Candidatus Thermoplasmatota archaeon]|nr:hypothetical protein [Candidatus Thermoplasmatota archaeon]